MKSIILIVFSITLSFQSFADGEKKTSIKLVNTIAGEGNEINNYHLKIPTDVALTKNQHIVVVDAGSHQIKFFDSDGKFIRQQGKFGSRLSEFYYPYSIDIDTKGILYISDLGNDRIQLFDQEGRNKGYLPFTTGNMRINSSNSLLATRAHGYFDFAIQNHDIFGGDSNIHLLTTNGEIMTTFSKKVNYNNQQLNVKGNEVYLDFDDSDNILVAYAFSNRIEKYDADGNLMWKKNQVLNFPETAPEEEKNHTSSFQEAKMNRCHSGIAGDEKDRIWVVTLNRQLNSEERVGTDLSMNRGSDGERNVSISVVDYTGPSTTDIFKIEVFNRDGILLSSIPLTHFVDHIRIYNKQLFLIDTFRTQQVYQYEITD